MTLSFVSLFSDTKNFVINRIMPILITLLILAIISQLVTIMFMPSEDTLLPLQQFLDNALKANSHVSVQAIENALARLTPQQQQDMVALVSSYVIKLLLVTLVTNLISTSICLSLISNLSNYNILNINQLITKALTLAPQILMFILLSVPFFFILILLSTLIAPLMIFIMLFGMVFYTIIYTIFLSTIVAPTSDSSLFSKIRESLYRFKQQYKLMLPIMGIWLIALLVFGSIISSVAGSNLIVEIIIGMIGLLLNFFLLSYFYRLYTLTTKTKHDTRN